ncbi:hypothetical protein [Paractinoplanes durhamensis]|uniref:Uncharacterized protein n=1 Tax=Paractinoplanes durhamensis TaxID=113563 RepID=A0ABQ3Z7A5_9ACTN|nr:hypothetical protein [Actinoplanes durhamensis]GIE05711.1 hypothetical protein Adu01nite_70610 [Actinoplanes durhamensis]
MIATRIASAVLLGVSLIALAACGQDTDTTAPAATAVAATPAAATSPAAPATSAAAVAAKADKEVCEDATKAAESLKKAVLVLAQSGNEIAPADAKALLTDFANNLTKAGEGADGKVATAIKANADAARKAAAAKDPLTAADTAESAKAGKDLNAACKAAGVKTTF